MAGDLSSNLDRVLVGSPLRRRRVGIVILIVLGLIVVVAGLVFCLMLAQMKADVLLVYAKALGLSLLVSLVPLALLRYLDRREREAPWAVLAAFLWGGVIASGWAILFNGVLIEAVRVWVESQPEIAQRLGPEASWLIGAPLVAPLTEEILKGIGVLLFFVLLRAEFDNMRDGLIYGALIGIGFNWTETAVWVASLYAEFDIAPWGIQFGGRFALFGLAGHALYTGLFGAGLGLARQTRRRWLRVLAPLAGLGLGMAAHALRNSLALIMVLVETAEGEPAPPVFSEPPVEVSFIIVFLSASLAHLILFSPFLIAALIALWRSGKWEVRVIREELRDEIGRAVTQEEYARVEKIGIFGNRRIAGLPRRRSARIVNAQNELAFRKRRVRLAGRDPDTDALVAAWRDEITQLRAASAPLP
jgi:RsiW-degrading membrane proteinase PrsW (M82 family)